MIASKTGRITILALALWAVFQPVYTVEAGDSFADGRLENSTLHITSTIEITLPEAALNALNARVLEISIVSEIRIYRIRNYWPDEKFVQIEVTDSIKRLSDDTYGLTSTESSGLTNFQSLEDALVAIGESRQHELEIPGDELTEDGEYHGRTRMYLDRSRLPSKMKVSAYLGNSWAFSSGWVEFDIWVAK